MFGLQVFSKDGKGLLINLHNRTSILLGEFKVQTKSGAYTDDRLLQGTPWWVCANNRNFNLEAGKSEQLVITSKDNKIFWNKGQSTQLYTIVYGVML